MLIPAEEGIQGNTTGTVTGKLTMRQLLSSEVRAGLTFPKEVSHT